MSTNGSSTILASSSFQRAVERFTTILTPKQRLEFQACTLEDVRREVMAIQDKRGSEKRMRSMAQIQKFLEGMDQYGKVVDAFLNCTPFLGYIWVTNTFAESLDRLLNAYQEIGERLPSFSQYQTLFESNLEMRNALELYFCDILEFHYHALRFLNRPGWKNLFNSSWKTFNSQFQRILDSLHRHKDLIESGKNTASLLELQILREKAETHYNEMADLERKRQLAVLIEKLNATDFEQDQDLACEQRKETRSGEWVLSTDEFRCWSSLDNYDNTLLYVHGVPGAGKTTIASLIVEWLQERRKGTVLYFYCKHSRPGKDTFVDILRGLILQAAYQDNALVSCLYDMVASTSQSGVSTRMENLAKTLFESQAISFVVLDGLDECEPKEAERAIFWLTSLQKDAAKPDSGQLRLLCVGQRTETLQRKLSSAASISLETADHHADIEKYVKAQARHIKEDFEISSQVEMDIVARITKSAKSMFLYAKLVLEHFMNQTTRNGLLKELEPVNFPVDLKDAYGRVISGILKSPQRLEAMCIIEWVACAKRPLRWREVQAIFFIKPKTGTCDYAGQKLRKSCKKLCSSIIDLQKGRNEPDTEAVLYLVHDTARDYLLRKDLLDISLQQAKMSIFCTEYLLSPPYCTITEESRLKELIVAGYYAFQDYACLHLFDYVKSLSEVSTGELAPTHQALTRLLNAFRETYSMQLQDSLELSAERETKGERYENAAGDSPKVKARNSWTSFEQQMSDIRNTIDSIRDKHFSDRVDKQTMTEIYGMAQFKCSRIECSNFSTGFDSKDTRDKHLDRHNRPFNCLENGCHYQSLGFESEKQLKTHLARTHAKGSNKVHDFPQPLRKVDNLHKASARGDLTAVRRFLDTGEDINSQNRAGETPIIIAARNSHLEICQALVEKGAITYLKSTPSNSSTPFHEAAANEDLEMVEYFLSVSSFSILEQVLEQRDGRLKTPVERASEKAAKAIVDLLQGWQRSYAFRRAVLNCEKEKVSILCKEGNVNIDLKDEKDRTPLSYAAQYGTTKIVELLLTTGLVNPDSKDHDGCTPLLYAAMSGRYLIAKLLLDTGTVDPDTRVNHRTPLSIAAERGNDDVVNLLLGVTGVDPNSRDGVGRSPLHHAALAGQITVVELLLTVHGVESESKDFAGQTPLSLATVNVSDTIVQWLLTVGKADPNSLDDDGRTRLHQAAIDGRNTTMKMLLATGNVDLCRKDKYGKTPLHYAVVSGEVATVKMLLATKRVDPNVIDSNGKTPLHLVTIAGTETVLRTLLTADKIDLNIQDENGMTPLNYAVKSGHFAIVSLILATNNVDVNCPNSSGETPLTGAVTCGMVEVVRILLATSDIDVNCLNSGGETPLAQAATDGMLEIVRLLLATSDVDVNCLNLRGETLLIKAVRWNWVEEVRLLLATSDVDVNSTNSSGGTPLTEAVRWNRVEVVKLLLAMERVDVNLPDRSGDTPLARAVIANNLELVSMLLKTGQVDAHYQGVYWAGIDLQQLSIEMARISQDGKAREIIELLIAYRNNDTDRLWQNHY